MTLRTAMTACLVLWVDFSSLGCGGSSTEESVMAPLNEPEQELVGTYGLTGFEVYEVGDLDLPARGLRDLDQPRYP